MKVRVARGPNDLNLVALGPCTAWKLIFGHTSPHNARVLSCSATLQNLDHI